MRSRAGMMMVVAAALMTMNVTAQTAVKHPDFTGEWALDVGKSEQGPITPQAMVYKITQQGDKVTVERDIQTERGSMTGTVSYGIDGKTWKNTMTQAGTQLDVSSVLAWADSTLVITNNVSVSGQDVLQEDRWTLGEGGRTLQIDRKVDMGGQVITARLLMVRRS